MSRNTRRGNRNHQRQGQTQVRCGLEALEDRCLLSTTLPVLPAPGGGGLVFHETPGQQFTADLGTFTSIAPGTSLKASINWGDGTTSAGTIKADHVNGLDTVVFEVDGTHTYAADGNYAITATVTRPGPTPTTLIALIATLHDTAVVSTGNISLNGKITGTYSLAPVNPVLGYTTVFNGTGTAGALGGVSAHGTVFVPVGEFHGQATGSLTLTSVSANPVDSGSVTLTLSGPAETAVGPIGVPPTMSYVISSGTGIYADATGSGVIEIKLGTNGRSNGFTFTIVSSIGVTPLPITSTVVPPLKD
jgi:hypothetical protein